MHYTHRIVLTTLASSNLGTLLATSQVYLGCYKDTVIRDLNSAFYTNPNMSVASCLQFCTGNIVDELGNRIAQGQGLSFAALQNGVQCFCGSTYGRYGSADDSTCNMPCKGDATQKCGGNLRNSIWKTWIVPTNSSNIGGGGGACPTLASTGNVDSSSSNFQQQPSSSSSSSSAYSSSFSNLNKPNAAANVAIIGTLVGLFFLLTIFASYMKYSKGMTESEYNRLLKAKERSEHRKSMVPSMFSSKSTFRFIPPLSRLPNHFKEMFLKNGKGGGGVVASGNVAVSHV